MTIDLEGPSLEMKIYLDPDPAALVKAHAIDAGPPVLPPRWMLTPWRWRDEHSQLATYYDGTPVTGPFNSQVMEDVLLMEAFGIPNGVYWVDRPYGPGRLGYDDFEIDPKRLPNFAEMVKWLNGQGAQMMLWIAPFFQGQMEKDALRKGYNLAGQPPQPNNYPLADLTNPAARAFWQAGFSKLLKLGVASFKLDRGEENIPEEGPFKVFDGRSIREQRTRLHQRLVDYAYRYVKEAASTGMPIVRPLFLVDPNAPEAWINWNTYLYGPDIVVSPIWEKGRREATVYLPAGGRWRDAWRTDQAYDGGRTMTVRADVHQIPLFVREGSGLDLGDLNGEYDEALAAARKRPDLKALDAEVAAWFAAGKTGPK